MCGADAPQPYVGKPKIPTMASVALSASEPSSEDEEERDDGSSSGSHTDEECMHDDDDLAVPYLVKTLEVNAFTLGLLGEFRGPLV